MKDILKTIWGAVKDAAKKKKTWALVIGGLVAALSLNLDPAVQEKIATCGSDIASLL